MIFLKKKHAYLSVSAVMFSKPFLVYTVHIDWFYHAIYKHLLSVGLNIYLYAHLCFDKLARLNLHSLKRHRGYRCLFEGRYLVFVCYKFYKLDNKK